MTRLAWKIYLALLATVLAFFVLSALLFFGVEGPHHSRELLHAASALAVEALPPAEAPRAELRERVTHLAAELGIGLGVFGESGDSLATAGPFVPAPERGAEGAHWVRGRGGSAAAVPLADGRWLVVRGPAGPPRHGPPWILHLALLAGVLAVGAWPMARSITRRLERVGDRVDALAAGDLTARAPVEGRDEVAQLARSVNRAAERIETLVGAQRTLLANASHELRSPLARLRVAAELVGEGAPAELQERISRDVATLDEAVDELLVGSRLELADASESHENVDLLALAAEEAARVGAEASGEPIEIFGDARSLRHLIRNLLANARRHGGGGPIDVEVRAAEDGAPVLAVSDRGPGIPPEERERIFEPFARGRSAADGGSGLGLAIVSHIARHHGGDARCLPREGGGSRFEVTLPGRSMPGSEPA